jgi:hypothetical protein
MTAGAMKPSFVGKAAIVLASGLAFSAPSATKCPNLKNGVDNRAQIGAARPSQRLGGRQVEFDHGPLGIGQVACVTLPRTLILRSSDFGPHVVPR